MRNNTKLKQLLHENDLNLSMEGNEIDLIVVNKETNISFMVSGSSITQVLNKAIKFKIKDASVFAKYTRS